MDRSGALLGIGVVPTQQKQYMNISGENDVKHVVGFCGLAPS